MQLVTKLLPVGSSLITLKLYSLYILETSRMAMANIQTFVFLDCETTGLPHLEHNKTRITELCLIGVESDCISLGAYPRVQNKLTLCFNPQKSVALEAARITGLCNENLQYQTSFSSDTAVLMNLFLDKFKKPICLVAHNGNRFDYPILQSELHRAGSALQDGILCVDSLLAFRDLHKEASRQDTVDHVHNVSNQQPLQVPLELQDGFDEILFDAVECLEAEHNEVVPQEFGSQKKNETTPPPRNSGSSSVEPRAPVKKRTHNTVPVNRHSSVSKAIRFPRPSFKLGDIYKRLTSKDPEDAHEAEGDVRLLIHCAAIVGEEFVEWANSSCKNFSEIPRMTPGKRIGT